MRAPAPAVAIIPVRLASQRLPRKALLDRSGRPLFVHTFEQACRADCFEGVWVATDDDAVESAARAAGAEVVRTSRRPRTGSERCAEAAAILGDRAAGAVVDIQGDWPEIDPADLRQLAQAVTAGGAPTATLAVPLRDPRRFADADVVKVVRGLDGNALYFSRAPVPHHRADGDPAALRHVGVYAFAAGVLPRITDLPSSGLAETEGLEQLRFLENGIPMRVLDAHGEPWGIETSADYEAFLHRLAARGAPRS